MSKPYFIESTPGSYTHPKSDCEHHLNKAINALNVGSIEKRDGTTGLWVIVFTITGYNDDEIWAYTSESARDKDYEKIVNGVYE